jgi:hypothetical protein
MQYFSEVSAIWSLGFNLPMSGTIKIKVNKLEDYAVIWNQEGKYCLFKVNVNVPTIVYCKIRSNITLLT